MRPEYLTRQSDLLDEIFLTTPITVVGAGAIGSFAVLTLVKLGFEDITVYDFDEIDDVNMNCQFYRFSDIGKKKVVALQELVRDFTEVEIKVVDGKFDPTQPHGEIVISAVDDMSVRKQIFDTVMKTTDKVFLLDGRMAAEKIAFYAGHTHDLEFCESYKHSLYTNEESVQERCTAKSTMYTVNLIAGLIGKTVKDFVTGSNHTASLTWDVGLNSAVWFDPSGKKLSM